MTDPGEHTVASDERVCDSRDKQVGCDGRRSWMRTWIDYLRAHTTPANARIERSYSQPSSRPRSSMEKTSGSILQEDVRLMRGGICFPHHSPMRV